MSNYTQLLYQLVFRTKWNKRTLIKQGRQTLYDYLAGILKNKNCFCYQIGGVEDHVHIIFSLHPTIALSKHIQDLKVASNKMIKEKQVFKNFESWADGYSAFTYSYDAKQNLINYVQNQEQHHGTKSIEIDSENFAKNTPSKLMRGTL